VTGPNHPPAVPRLLLERFVPGNAALAGDIEEEYRRRGSAAWYWQQALAAIAVHVTTDVFAHKLVAFQAIVTGWTALWLFSFVGAEINRFMSGWFLDRLILVFWTHPFPMMWATQLSTRPAQTLGFLISGWVVARLHRAHGPAMLMAFTGTVVLWTAYVEVHAALMRTTPVPYPLLDVLLKPLPLLILVGVMWTSQANRPRQDPT
jgi:hypothetical protein